MLPFLNLILCVSKDNKTGLCVHDILLTRLGFCGPKGCTCTLPRDHGLREVAYLPTSLSTGKGTKILTLAFLGAALKVILVLFLENLFQIYDFIIQVSVGGKVSS